VTGSADRTLRLWDLKNSVVLKKMEGHRRGVWAVRVSRLIASGDGNGEFIFWNGDTGEFREAIKAHVSHIRSLDFSPDGKALATGSDKETKLWSKNGWKLQGNAINIDCRDGVYCVRYSPSGEHLAIATEKNIQIWKPGTMECIANFKGHRSSQYLTHVDTRCTSSHIGQ